AATATAAAAWPGHHASPAATSPAAAVAPPAPAQYDPTVRTVDFGALPAGLAPHGSELTAARQVAYAGVADPRHGAVTQVELVVHARGWDPDHPDQGDDVACARGARTDPVNGRPAYLAAQPGGHMTNMRCLVGLVWEYAPDSWAEVHTVGDSTSPRHQA